MKVVCKKLFDKNTGGEIEKNDWLSVGGTYEVVFIERPEDQVERYRVVSDDPSTNPMLFDSSLFEVISGPEVDWTSETVDGVYRLGPSVFMKSGFWWNLFEGEVEEVEIYRNYLRFLGIRT